MSIGGATLRSILAVVSHSRRSIANASRRSGATLANAEWELTEAGRALLQRGRAADAVEVFRLVSDLYRTSASAQAALARGYEAAGDSAKARAQVRRALEIDPNEPWAREIARRARPPLR